MWAGSTSPCRYRGLEADGEHGFARIASTASNDAGVNVMEKKQSQRPVEEGVDPSNEEIILDQIKVPAEEKKPSPEQKDSQATNSRK